MEYKEWKIRKSMPGEYDIVTEDDYIATVGRHFDARLIVTAVNACIKLNQKHPLAVAESIPDLYASYVEKGV